MTTKFPIFIPSKGRHDIRMTAHKLREAGVDFRLIVEPQEVKKYQSNWGTDSVVELDMNFQKNYDTCDEYGDRMSKGSGASRNYAWQIALEEKHTNFWVIDDNLKYFHYIDQEGFIRARNLKKWFTLIEQKITKPNNVVMGGPADYRFVVYGQGKFRRYKFNTRVYSFSLIRSNIPMRFRGRFNEDTILSIDILKAGFATTLIHDQLFSKSATNVVKGGNTDALYGGGGKTAITGPKSRQLKQVHPDVVKIVARHGRIHHYVNYRKHFINNPVHIA